MTPASFLTHLLTEIAWNFAVWLPALLLSLAFVRLVLGVRLRELAEEVEQHQTAAVGAVFFCVSLGVSLLLGRTIAPPVVGADTSWAEAFAWLAVAFLSVLLLFGLGTLLVFGTLARRRGEGTLAYLRRELRQEHNLALSFILGTLFTVPVVVAYHITL